MKSDLPDIHRFLGEVHYYAMQLMENGDYILKQLPSLRMPDALRHQLETLCSDLIGIKHDLIHEIHEVHELMMASPDASTSRDGVERMCQWVNEANIQFKAGVDGVQIAMDAGETDGLLWLLLTESGVNILSATPSRPYYEEVADSDPEDVKEGCQQAVWK